MLKADLEKELFQLKTRYTELMRVNTELATKYKNTLKDIEKIELCNKELEHDLKSYKDNINLLCHTHLRVMYPLKTERVGEFEHRQAVEEDEHYRFINSLIELGLEKAALRGMY